MAGTGVTEFVHTFDDGVESRVVTDGGVRAPEVVVNRTGDADNRDIPSPPMTIRASICSFLRVS